MRERKVHTPVKVLTRKSDIIGYSGTCRLCFLFPGKFPSGREGEYNGGESGGKSGRTACNPRDPDERAGTGNGRTEGAELRWQSPAAPEPLWTDSAE